MPTLALIRSVPSKCARVEIFDQGDADKYRIKLLERFQSIQFVVAKKADGLYPVVSGASIVVKVTRRDRALQNWYFDETAENMDRNFGSGYPGDPGTKGWIEHHKHSRHWFASVGALVNLTSRMVLKCYDILCSGYKRLLLCEKKKKKGFKRRISSSHSQAKVERFHRFLLA